MSPSRLTLAVAVTGGGVSAGSRASTGLAFSAFALNSASALPATASSLADVLINANGLRAYVLTSSELSFIPLSGGLGAWPAAPLLALAAAPGDGSSFAALALAPN